MFLRELFDSTPTIGIIFGRFNPPHLGHKAAWEMASHSDHWFVGTNESTHGDRDPLLFEDKIAVMTSIYPELDGHIIPETSWLTMASKLFEEYGHAHLKCFTDEDWVVNTILAYNNQHNKHGFYNFKSISQVKTPRLSSATKLREAVKSGDRELFLEHAGVASVNGKDYFELVSEAVALSETVKKVKGRWALVSKSDPNKVLQYYHGSEYPSKEWIKNVERRVHSFEDAAGVGIITKQNTTTDVGPGTLYKNLKAFGLTGKVPKSKKRKDETV